MHGRGGMCGRGDMHGKGGHAWWGACVPRTCNVTCKPGLKVKVLSVRLSGMLCADWLLRV